MSPLRSALKKASCPGAHASSALLAFNPKPRDCSLCSAGHHSCWHSCAWLSVNKLSTSAIPGEGLSVCLHLPYTPTLDPASRTAQPPCLTWENDLWERVCSGATNSLSCVVEMKRMVQLAARAHFSQPAPPLFKFCFCSKEDTAEISAVEPMRPVSASKFRLSVM